MNIFDLNHIEAVEGNEIVGGSGWSYNGGVFKIDQDVDIDFKEKIKKDIDVASKFDVSGNTAITDGKAEAIGDVTFTNLFGSSLTGPYGSQSQLVSVAYTK
ncbi:MAG: hypothetical protein ACFB2X_06420 [Rivularia sp. (in: cyanobacteria)]